MASWAAWGEEVDHKIEWLRRQVGCSAWKDEPLRAHCAALEVRCLALEQRCEALELDAIAAARGFGAEGEVASAPSEMASAPCRAGATPPRASVPSAPSPGPPQEIAVRGRAFQCRGHVVPLPVSEPHHVLARRAIKKQAPSLFAMQSFEECLRQDFHTDAFEEWGDEVDQTPAHGGQTTEDGEGPVTGFCSRLQGMNIPLALKSLNTNPWGLLADTFVEKAKRGNKFILDWHQSGTYNRSACTSVICMCCGAKLVIHHPGMPAKGNGTRQDPAMQSYVDFHLSHFLFREENILSQDLLHRGEVCTVERHFAGSVIDCAVTQK